MKRLSNLTMTFSILVLFIANCSKSKYQTIKSTDPNGYIYETVTNDPMGVRIYTLKNGLKVYFTVIKDAPRIQTLISVNAGSLIDPEQTTGLAHYFEHMMFKGTNHFGTTNWEKEKPLLAQISDLFEKRRAAKDSTEKLKIFASIDSLSIIASAYAIPNEYDKLMKMIGSQGTNAFTNFQSTCYTEDIPSNEIDRWLNIELDRFSNIALRLFHTELETVYEEFNMGQDRDSRRLYYAKMGGLFPKHPLGREVLGLGEHLKNPSMVNIQNFFKSYYVPNNMAIIMSGDFDMDKTIQKIDRTFGQLPSKPFTKPQLPKEEPVKAPIVKEIYGPEAENLQLAFRFNGDSTEDKKYVTLIDMLLNNSVAGLIDLDLVQQQKILKGGSYTDFYVDYGIHTFWGYPRDGQSLETVRDLLLKEIDKIKKGEFDDWLLNAVVNDLRLQRIRNEEYYQNRAYRLNEVFLNHEKWEDQVNYLNELGKITKDQIIKFANEHYNNNYVVAYKRKGIDKTILKMPKPKITPININRNDQSDFYTSLFRQKPEPMKPVFLDFSKEIQQKEVKPGITSYYLPNKTNELFSLNYIIDMGKSSDKELEHAVRYLQYVGTDKYTPAQVQQEFYKLGVQFGVYTGNDRSYVYVSGLSKSMEQAAGLLEHLLTHAKADTASYRKYVEGVIKNRANAKMNKDYILWNAMASYGKYGKNSPFTDILQEKELRNANPNELTDIVKKLVSYKQKIFYYGTLEKNAALAIIQKQHPLPENPKECILPVKYLEANFTSRQIYFVDFDMVQTNFVLMNKLVPFNQDLLPFVELYNNYYHSIVFQEIREARGLAYSASAWIETPGKKDKSFFTGSFVATQADKLNEATSNLMMLINNMKEDPRQFNLAKESILNRIETERITKSDIFWTYLSNLDKGITKDIRKDIYEKVKVMNITDLKNFLEKYPAKNYTLLIIGKKGMINTNVLRKLGDYKELNLQEIFNY